MKPETVSLCVIAYNEETFLPKLFNDFIGQTYPHDKIEVVLVDGKSTDHTNYRSIKQQVKDIVEGGFKRRDGM